MNESRETEGPRDRETDEQFDHVKRKELHCELTRHCITLHLVSIHPTLTLVWMGVDQAEDAAAPT